eukprot:243275_1
MNVSVAMFLIFCSIATMSIPASTHGCFYCICIVTRPYNPVENFVSISELEISKCSEHFMKPPAAIEVLVRMVNHRVPTDRIVIIYDHFPTYNSTWDGLILSIIGRGAIFWVAPILFKMDYYCPEFSTDMRLVNIREIVERRQLISSGYVRKQVKSFEHTFQPDSTSVKYSSTGSEPHSDSECSRSFSLTVPDQSNSIIRYEALYHPLETIIGSYLGPITTDTEEYKTNDSRAVDWEYLSWCCML